MGVFPRFVALALGLTACASDVPAVELASSATQTACQGLAHLCLRGDVAPLLEHSVCLSLTLNHAPEYAICWPGSAPDASAAERRSGKLILTAFREDARPCTGSSCGSGHQCLCLNAGGNAPAWALTVTLPHPPGIHATGCLILGTQHSPTQAASPAVTLRL